MNYRNKKLLDLARGQSCVACGATDDTIVSAHSNLAEHGKGMGIKADDSMIAWLCYRCHAQLDQGGAMTRAERREFTLKYICETYRQMWKQGLIGVVK